MWSMIKSCTGAWQGGRVLDTDGQRTYPAQRERSRALTNFAAHGLWRLHLAPKRRIAQLLSALMDLHRSFIWDRRRPVSGPGFGCAPVEVDGAAMARAFEAA